MTAFTDARAAINGLNVRQLDAIKAVASANGHVAVLDILNGERPTYGLVHGAVAIDDANPENNNRITTPHVNELRQIAANRVLVLSIANCTDLNEGRQKALAKVVGARDANAIRQALHDERLALGDLSLIGNTGNPVMITDAAALELRKAAAQKLIELSFEATKQLGNGRNAALLALATANGEDNIRQAIQDHRQHFGHLDLTGCISGAGAQHIISNPLAVALKKQAAHRLCQTSIANFKDLNAANKSALLALATANATNTHGIAAATAIRTALNNNNHKVVLGNLDLTGNTGNENIMTSVAAVALQQQAAQQLFELSIKAFADLRDNRDAVLLSIASANGTNGNDANHIRAALVVHQAVIGGFNLNTSGAHDNGDIITDAAAKAIRQLAAQQLLERTLKNFTDLNGGRGAVLEAIFNANGVNGIRQALHDHSGVLGRLSVGAGGAYVNNDTVISDAAAHDLKRLAREKYLSFQKRGIWKQRYDVAKAANDITNETEATVGGVFDDGKILKSEALLLAQKVANKMALGAQIEEKAVTESPNHTTHTIEFPNKKAIMKREQVDNESDMTTVTSSKLSQLDMFRMVAKFKAEEFRLKGKDPAKDTFTMHEVIPDTLDARQDCETALREEFTFVEIKRKIGLGMSS